MKMGLMLLKLIIVCLLWVNLGLSHRPLGGEQPLSNINILSTSLALHPHASINASPVLLGLKGEDTEWVDVKLWSPNPSSDDWIGVFSPAKFKYDLLLIWPYSLYRLACGSSSSCYSEADVKDQQPYICSAPIKVLIIMEAVHAQVNLHVCKHHQFWLHQDWKATLRFQLINQRADFSFALFSGGLSNPTLVAVSHSISFANPKAPLYPRLALGKSRDEITVTWTSGYSIDEAVPLVEWGFPDSIPKQAPAGTLTFTRNTLCGAPARTVGWRDPGFIHTSFLKDLWPNRPYMYRLGHLLSNGSYVWSKKYTFKAPPYPGQDSLQRVIVFGDMGKAERDGSNEYSNYQPGSLNTTDQLIKDINDIDIVFHIGDITYANGYLSQWDQFTSQVEPIASAVPYMIASGNHERDWPNSGSFYDGVDSGGECGVLAQTMFYVPIENRDKFWYKADYGMFRFCIADTEHDWREGTEQYKFIEHCLSTVDRQKQPWLIFAAHRVLGYSSDKWYGLEGSFEEPMGREGLQKLWQRYKVDMAFYGHVHNYERSCPIYQNQCVTSEKSYYSGTVNGTIHVVAGGGGSHLSEFGQLNTKWSLHKDFDHGFVKLTAFNHSSLLFEYKKSRDGNVYDSFTISRDYRDVLACIPDGCEPTTSAS
ncbi:putative inactive purple acid phosphatase 27 [Bienertia sinuspersici]